MTIARGQMKRQLYADGGAKTLLDLQKKANLYNRLAFNYNGIHNIYQNYCLMNFVAKCFW